MTPVLDQARGLAARTTRKIKALRDGGVRWDILDADRERVASDLRAIERAEEGLRACWLPLYKDYGDMAYHAARYTEARDDAWTSLQRTAALYGEKP